MLNRENHEIKVIIDFHDTLNDKYDSPIDNVVEKTFFIEHPNPTTILLDSLPRYYIQGTTLPIITATLLDSDSKVLANKKIIFNFNNNDFTLTTNKEGKVSFSSAASSFGTIEIKAFFEGDRQHSSVNASLTAYSLPKETSSAMVLKFLDVENRYDFEEYPVDIVIFQDSYENLIGKLQPNSTNLFDSKTFWISLDPKHDYFAEIYMNGRLLFVTDKAYLNENAVLVNELKIPETAKIKFKVTDEQNQAILGGLVENWVYSSPALDGSTDWIDVLPTKFDEPYVAQVILSDQKIIKSKPFFVVSGERKIIEIVVKEKYFVCSYLDKK